MPFFPYFWAIGGGMSFFDNDPMPNIFAMGQRPINHSARPLKTHRYCKRTRSRR